MIKIIFPKLARRISSVRAIGVRGPGTALSRTGVRFLFAAPVKFSHTEFSGVPSGADRTARSGAGLFSTAVDSDMTDDPDLSLSYPHFLRSRTGLFANLELVERPFDLFHLSRSRNRSGANHLRSASFAGHEASRPRFSSKFSVLQRTSAIPPRVRAATRRWPANPVGSCQSSPSRAGRTGCNHKCVDFTW